MEKTLVEIKAKVKNLNKLRKKLKEFNAKRIGIFKQVDFYFKVPVGRLKIRKVNETSVKLIYYEREDIPKPKKCRAFILDISDEIANIIFRVLEEWKDVVVSKIREVYNLTGVKIHLDFVNNLGSFLEFELEVDPKKVTEAKLRLLNLLKKFDVKKSSMESFSYSDMIRVMRESEVKEGIE